MFKNIDLCVFISSKDRYGRKDDFKVTLNSFKSLININLFQNKFLSFKKFKNDNYENIEKFFSLLNFNIYSIFDEFERKRENRYDFITGTILKDISLFFTENNFSEYLFLLEDDSPIIIKNKDLEYYINYSKDLLDKNENLCSIHFPRLSWNYIPCDADFWIKHWDMKIENNIIKNNYWYNFQPRLVRTKNVIKASKIILDNWDNFKYCHPEEGFKQALLFINKNFEFWAFDPFYAYSIHLGEEYQYHQMILDSEPKIKKIYENSFV